MLSMKYYAYYIFKETFTYTNLINIYIFHLTFDKITKEQNKNSEAITATWNPFWYTAVNVG